MALAALGEMFKCVKGPIDGPVLLHSYPTMNTVLVGEDHRINGSGSAGHEHVWDIIKTYAAAHPRKTIRLFLEATPSDLYLFRDHCNSPLSTTIKDYFTHMTKIPKNIIPEQINVRRYPPLCALEILYDEPTYIDIQTRMKPQMTMMDVFKFHQQAKQFEKAFYAHVNTRAKCSDFFISIVSPISATYPVWFNTWLDTFGISKTENPLRDLLRDIHKSDPKFAQALLAVLGNMFSYTVDNNAQYSPAMISMEKTRRTASSNMVAAKYPTYMTFWISVNSIFMDVYVMALMKKYESVNGDTFVLMAGFNHVSNIAKYMPTTMKRVSMFNRDGVLRDIGNVPDKLAESPTTLLAQFRQARAHANKK